MEPRATLAVVIPTLEEERSIGALVRRLLSAAQAADQADHVVVSDGGSLDGTRALAAEAGALVITAPHGRGSQLAAGARAARGELLVFLHADCRPEPGALAAVRAAFDDPAVGWGGFVQRVEAQGWFFRAVERAANARVRRGDVYGDSGLCVRRTLYERAGGFPELPLFEDVELSRRLRALSAPKLFGGAALAVSARRWQREGALRATARNWMLRLAFAAGVPPVRLARFYPPEPRRQPQ